MGKALFGAGCFWGVEAHFRKIKGVIDTAVGYSGGHTDSPSYEDVCTGTTGHAEVVFVEFDEKVVSYEELLEAFWEAHDPTTPNRQGPDVGTQYRSAIFYFTEEQQQAAHASLKIAQKSFKEPIVTEIAPANRFFRAEEYHQRYLEKNKRGFCGLFNH